MTDSPLLYLTLCSLRNRLRVRLRRLREPRYLIGTIVGAAYFYMVFWRPRSRVRRAGSPVEAIGAAHGPIELAGALLMFGVVALAWLWPGSRRPALAFSRPEVQLLFTAPISRRRLVRYKVLRSLVGTLMSSGIMTLVFRRTGGAWTFFIGMTLLMALLNMHFTGVSLSRARVTGDGPSSIARRLPRAIMATAVAVLGFTLVTHWTELTTAAGDGDLRALFQRLATTGPSGVVLWPFLMLVRLPLAESGWGFLAALPWMLLMLAVNYVWVQRLDVPFEEASAELSEKLARLRKGQTTLRQPRGSVSTPFPLSIDGRPETAILWKNLILMGRYLSWKLLLRVAPLAVFLAFAFRGAGRSDDGPGLPAALCLMIAAFAIFLGPQMVRSDLRYDLANLSVLKTWPIRGATLVRGELLAPAIVLTAIVSVALLATTVLTLDMQLTGRITDRWALLVATLMLAPGIILAQLLVQNGLAVTFPAWVGIGAPRGGVDVMGQRMIMLAATLIALVVAVLPAAIVGGLAAFLYYSIAGSIPLVVPGMLAAVTLFGEAFLGSELVGAILDRTDLSAIDAGE